MDFLGNLSRLIAILLMMAGIPAFMFVYSATKDPVISIILFVVYEIVVFVGGFVTKVWEDLEGKWTKRLADRIDLILRPVFSGYRHRYFEYITYQHRFFDVKGLRTQGQYSLELEKVFVELSVDPIPAHQATSNPIQNIPESLRTGGHKIWEFINAKELVNCNLAIIGSPGCGKTTLLKHMALTLAIPARRRESTKSPYLLPILLFLRDHANDIKTNPEIKLAKLIHDQFERRQAPLPPDGWLENQLGQGKCLIMLDGLDEVPDLAIRKIVVKWVEHCMAAYGKNRFVISSRPHGYTTNPIEGVTVLQVRPFTSTQVKQFVHNWYLANELMSSQKNDPGVRADAKLGAEDLLKRIYGTPTLSELAVNPLLLTMIATVHRYRSSLPGRRVELYSEICEVVLGKRQEARGIVSDLTPKQKQRVLQPLAYHLMNKEVREVNQDDIQPAIMNVMKSVNPNVNCADFIKDIENTSGLLVERESGIYGFSHLTFQEYLTAVHVLENQLEFKLIENVNESWWHETIRLYCAQTDASNIIQACLNSVTVPALVLAIDCMDEAREVNSETRQRFNDLIEYGLETSGDDRRRLIAEAHLKSRFKTNLMYRIDENTYIDPSLITCAEYQLFIDEMRLQGKFLQPDHWTSYQYPMGQARLPILGVRSSDAIAFCEWLTKREVSQWVYRIPKMAEATVYPIQSLIAPLGHWANTGSGLPSIFMMAGDAENKFTDDLDLARDLDVLNNTSSLDLTPEIVSILTLALDRNLADDLALDLACDNDLALDLTRILARGRAEARPIAQYLDRTRSNVFNFDRDRSIVFNFDRDRVVDRARSLVRALELDLDSDRNLDLNLDRARTRALDLARAQALARARDLVGALDHYRFKKEEILGIYSCILLTSTFINIALYLLLIRLRRGGTYPAFEGIRIVKEHKP